MVTGSLLVASTTLFVTVAGVDVNEDVDIDAVDDAIDVEVDDGESDTMDKSVFCTALAATSFLISVSDRLLTLGEI